MAKRVNKHRRGVSWRHVESFLADLENILRILCAKKKTGKQQLLKTFSFFFLIVRWSKWASWGLCWPMLASSWASSAHLGAILGHVGAKMADKSGKMAIKSAKMSQDRRQEDPR